jgi:hypothetical protein
MRDLSAMQNGCRYDSAGTILGLWEGSSTPCRVALFLSETPTERRGFRLFTRTSPFGDTVENLSFLNHTRDLSSTERGRQSLAG